MCECVCMCSWCNSFQTFETKMLYILFRFMIISPLQMAPHQTVMSAVHQVRLNTKTIVLDLLTQSP
jgi:hypothetical protein